MKTITAAIIWYPYAWVAHVYYASTVPLGRWFKKKNKKIFKK